MQHVTIHLASATPHYYDVVRRHRSPEAAKAFAASQNAATLRRYPTAYACYAAVEVDDEGRVYRGGTADIADDGVHRKAR